MTDWEMGLAATKLQPPMLPASLVRRSRVLDLLTTQVRFVLVCAPAGSGKSTLLASWLPSREESVAWLQVEPQDSDPARFWSYLLQAIGRVVALPDQVQAIVRASGTDETAVVTAVVNGLAALAAPLRIVIDDYHLVSSAAVHRGMERIIELCPDGVTIVIATRLDPPFRLSRFRLRGYLTEVRNHDLCFAPEEAAGLLLAASPSLESALVQELCQRTEGWAAGLVLAGLSLSRTSDPRAFVDAFSGNDELVVEYLRDELLRGMSSQERQRLLETSVLEQLSGPLVDAVTASTGGGRWLEEMATGNQLVIRLSPGWFRYHHLLRDLLRVEAQSTFTGQMPEQHARAAAWFESNGEPGQAIHHRLAAGQADAAAQLLLAYGQQLLKDGQVETLRGMLDALGRERVQSFSWCALFYGWCEYLAGRYAEAESWLDAFDKVAPAALDVTVAASLRINISLARGNVAAALALAREVDSTGKLPAANCDLATAVGAAYALAGQSENGRRVLRYAADRAGAEGFPTALVMAQVYRSILELVDGSVSAGRSAQTAVDTATAFGLASYHGVGAALAVRARCGARVTALADVEHAVSIARRASTDLLLGFTLTACADTLLAAEEPPGHALLLEAQDLLRLCPDPGVVGRYLTQTSARHGGSLPRPRETPLVEQLTERELAVLRYLPGLMSQRQIAQELYVSLNTTKTHCAAIYRKLGVSDRRSAVQAARDLSLL